MTGVGAIIGSFMKEPEDAGPNDAFYYGTSAIEGLAAGAMLVVISNAMYVLCIITSQPTRIDPLPCATGYRKHSDKEEASPVSLYSVGTNSIPFFPHSGDQLTMRYLPPPPQRQGFWLLSSWSSPTSGEHCSNRIHVTLCGGVGVLLAVSIEEFC
jgi:hypothetical protein